MKDKAKELVEKFAGHKIKYLLLHGWLGALNSAKKDALICVDEIIEAYNNTMKNGQLDSDNCYFIHKYWQGVKQEIEKLNN